MMNRRTLLVSAGAATALSVPYLSRANAQSGTPVVNGQRVRRRLSSLGPTDPFFEAYSLAVERMRAEPDTNPLSWIAQARTHADFCAHSRSSVNLNFFSWHRPYLESFEFICGEMIGDPDFALPYWYWPDDFGRLPQPFFDLPPLNTLNWNDDGNYNGIGWGAVSTVNYRFLSPGVGLLDTPFGGSFSEATLNQVLGSATFRLLTQLVEGDLHGTPHVVLGGNPAFGLGTDEGHMSSGLSPLEAMFWLHHCMVDFMWASSGVPVADQLAEIDDPDARYTDFFDAAGMPRDIRVGDLFEMENQTFTYDQLVPELLSDEERAATESVIASQDSIRAAAESQNISVPNVEQDISAPVVPEGPAAFGVVNRISVPVEALFDRLSERQLVSRKLPTGETAVGIGSRRIYAEFNNVQVTNLGGGGAVKVFVDCPYLNRSTPTSDPHFAGNMSFFGCSTDTCGSKSFVVDVTEPLQYRVEQGEVPTAVNLQILPYDGLESPLGGEVATVGEVKLISV